MAVGYGFFPGGDPRAFTPDEECSTAEERAAHAKACAEADAAEAAGKDPSIPCPSGWERRGDTVVHFSRAPFGFGTYEYDDEEEGDADHA